MSIVLFCVDFDLQQSDVESHVVPQQGERPLAPLRVVDLAIGEVQQTHPPGVNFFAHREQELKGFVDAADGSGAVGGFFLHAFSMAHGQPPRQGLATFRHTARALVQMYQFDLLSQAPNLHPS